MACSPATLTAGLCLGFLLTLVAPASTFAFDLQGHRGARGLAPENTLPAFAAALTLGVDTLEFDVGVTRDGHIVIAHDRRLSPDIAQRPDGKYVDLPGPAIRALTLDEIKSYDVGTLRPRSAYANQFPAQKPVPGTRVPTLAELAALVRKAGNGSVRFNVETKLSPLAPDETVDPETFATALVKELRETGLAQRASIQSFDWRTLKVVQRIAPEIPTVCLTIGRGQGDNLQLGRSGASPWLAGLDADDFISVPRLVRDAGCKVWSPFFRDTTNASIVEARLLGLKVAVWTVNEPADMAAMLDQGVDSIITDYPDRLRAAMDAKNMDLPRPSPVRP
jgi:glycerophosphoryl diester phosphodiesterase